MVLYMEKNDVNQSFTMDYDYDYQNDSLFLHITDDYHYKRSLRLDEDIIIDFDVDNVPVAMEILHASKRFNTPRLSLRNPIGLNMHIEIGDDYIHIKAAFEINIRNKFIPLELNAEGENSINLPSQATHFAAIA